MSTDRGTTASGRRVLLLAASATVVVAVGSDVVAGGHPLHTATLGAVAAAIAVLRLRLAGRHNGPFAAISAAILAQPVLHAATKLLPSGTESVAAAPGHAAAEASVTVLHVLVAALIVCAVVGVEQLYLLVAALAPLTEWLGLLLWRPLRPQPALSSPPPPVAPARRWSFVAHIPRRGPPAPARAAS